MLDLEIVSARRLMIRFQRRIKVSLMCLIIEYYLMEKLNVIKKELGMDKGGKDKTNDKFRKRAEKVTMPEHIKVVFEEVCLLVFNE
jgi:ATP-dependent Lon protease